MSQLAASEGQPRCSGGGAGFFLRRLETVRSQAECWQEPHESRGSRMVLRGTGGEIPPVYPTPQSNTFRFLMILLKYLQFRIVFNSQEIVFWEI